MLKPNSIELSSFCNRCRCCAVSIPRSDPSDRNFMYSWISFFKSVNSLKLFSRRFLSCRDQRKRRKEVFGNDSQLGDGDRGDDLFEAMESELIGRARLASCSRDLFRLSKRSKMPVRTCAAWPSETRISSCSPWLNFSNSDRPPYVDEGEKRSCLSIVVRVFSLRILLERRSISCILQALWPEALV